VIAKYARIEPASNPTPNSSEPSIRAKAQNLLRLQQKAAERRYIFSLFFSSRPTHSNANAEQRMPITWTACHFGEPRSWFSCAAPGDVQQPLFAIHAD
jgi:hypothetical protein